MCSMAAMATIRWQAERGNDTLSGGAGIDTADYSGAAGGITVELWRSLVSNDGQGGTDTLISIEALIASAFNDTLSGDGNSNVFKGSAGFDGIFGGDGFDTVDYSGAASGVTVELFNSRATNDGQGAGDFLSSIENVIGSAFNDTLIGDGGGNVFMGGVGFDAFFGGGDIDTADYSRATAGISVALWNSQTSNDGQGGADFLSSIEVVAGSAFNDIISGDHLNNVFRGGAGFDQFYGGAGVDTADYSDARSGVTVNLAQTTASADGYGTSDFLNSIENVTGSDFSDSLTGDGLDNIFKGNAGNDTINGVSGVDTVDYSEATSGVIATVGVPVAGISDGQGGVDTLLAIDNLIGSSFADVLVGSFDPSPNKIEGGAGNDTMTGAGGDISIDTFVFRSGSGVDTITDFRGSIFPDGFIFGGDRIVLENNLNGSGITTPELALSRAAQVGSDVVIDLGGGNSVSLIGIALSSLAAFEFSFV